MLNLITSNPTFGAVPGLSQHQENLAERLRRARKQKGWSQESLAQNADTSQAVIQKIENGKSLRPRNIERIAEALDVRPAWLMFGVSEVENLDEEAVQVARAWTRLKEPERSAMKETIRRLAEG
jgi:transcriptional regulator with XRE-family HTH domain